VPFDSALHPFARLRAKMTKILVVDDEPVIVNLLKRFLEKKSFEVMTASSGFEAMTKVKEEKPKIVILDIYMPGKSGLEVLKEIKEHDKDTGVIMVTAVTDEATGRNALDMGAFDYIIKPFDLDYLEKVLWWKLKLMD
jgi:DNA-binding response OmpR family regulator